MERWTRPWTRSSTQSRPRWLSSSIESGDPGHDQFLEERLLQIPERPLDFALAFRVARLAGLDLDAVVTGELERRRMQHEPAALGLPESAHPIGPSELHDAAGGVEEPGHPLEGVLAVDRRGEPPDPPTRPAQDHPETPQRRRQPDVTGPCRAVRPVELRFLARAGLDRHRRRVSGPEPGAALITDPAHHRRIRPGEALSRDDLEQRRGQQLRVPDQQRVQPVRPHRIDHPIRVIDGAARRRTTRLHPLRDRRRVIPQLVADLLERHALGLHRQHVHELLLRHHEQRSLQRICRCLVARQAGGATHSPVGSQEEHPPQTTRLSLIADRDFQ